MCSTSRSAHRSTSAERASLLALWLGAALCGVVRAQPAGPAPAAPAAAAPAAPAGAGAGAAQVPISAPTGDAPQFAQAMEAVRRGDLVETARLCWAYLKGRE